MNPAASRLELGVVLPPCPSGSELRAAAECADSSEMHSLWVTDRTIAGMPWLDALTVLGALATATRRVQIGTSVLVLARRNPVHVAHALASVEHLSDGRLIAGIGVGNAQVSTPEFDIAGVDIAERGRLTDQYVDLLRDLWTKDSVDRVGSGWRCAGTSLQPRPERHVPIWIGGAGRSARIRAGRVGDGWLAVFSSPDTFPTQWADVQSAARRQGRDAGDIVPATYLFGAIDDDGTSARETLDAVLPGFLGAPLDAVADTCIWGTPEQWLGRLEAWRAAGVRQVNVALFTRRLVHDIDIIADRVLPFLSGSASRTPLQQASPA